MERSDGETSRKCLSSLHIKFNLPPLSFKTLHSFAVEEKKNVDLKEKEQKKTEPTSLVQEFVGRVSRRNL